MASEPGPVNAVLATAARPTHPTAESMMSNRVDFGCFDRWTEMYGPREASYQRYAPYDGDVLKTTPFRDWLGLELTCKGPCNGMRVLWAGVSLTDEAAATIPSPINRGTFETWLRQYVMVASKQGLQPHRLLWVLEKKGGDIQHAVYSGKRNQMYKINATQLTTSLTMLYYHMYVEREGASETFPVENCPKGNIVHLTDEIGLPWIPPATYRKITRGGVSQRKKTQTAVTTSVEKPSPKRTVKKRSEKPRPQTSTSGAAATSRGRKRRAVIPSDSDSSSNQSDEESIAVSSGEEDEDEDDYDSNDDFVAPDLDSADDSSSDSRRLQRKRERHAETRPEQLSNFGASLTDERPRPSDGNAGRMPLPFWPTDREPTAAEVLKLFELMRGDLRPQLETYERKFPALRVSVMLHGNNGPDEVYDYIASHGWYWILRKVLPEGNNLGAVAATSGPATHGQVAASPLWVRAGIAGETVKVSRNGL